MTITDTTQPDGGAPTNRRTGPTPLLGALAGLLAAGAALAAGELAGAFTTPSPGPVVAVANRVIDEAPTWFVDFGKAIFGLADKPALIIGTVLLSALFGALLGWLSLRARWIGMAGIGLFGLIGAISIGVDAQGSWSRAVIVTLVAVAAGWAALTVLLNQLGDHLGAGSPAQPDRGLRPRGEVVDSPIDPAVSRRKFLGWAGTVGVVSAAGAAGSRSLRAQSSVALARDAVVLEGGSTDGLTEIIEAANAGPVGSTPRITPIVVPNDDFYLIDTALVTPQVDPAEWSLTIRGMVDNEVTYTYDELLERSETIASVTLSCVSNEVGGNLVGNAVWRGVPLTDLLDEAGVQPGATQIASRSVDGWNCGFPTEAAYDGRTALVAVGMNGEPLPLRHGFPARLVVSGLYGYVSATKWLKEIELTTIEGFNGYWIPRGWSKLGPIKTQSRIDTPSNGERLAVGTDVPIAGVAWSPDKGITKVEVQVDEGEWMEAELGETLGEDSWRQWLLPWTVTEGTHAIRVRATDGAGDTQTPDLAPPAPSGATGWHQVGVIGA